MLSADKMREYISSVVVILVSSLLTLLPIPILSSFASAVAIALLGYITTKYHYTFIVAAILSVFVVQLICTANILTSALGLLPFVLCGLTFGVAFNIRLAPVKAIALSAASYTLYIVVNLKLYSLATDGANLFEEALSSAAKVYEEMYTTASGGQLTQSEIHTLVTTLTSTVMRYIPSMIVIICIVFSLLSFYLFKRICKLRKNDTSNLTPFSDWRSEKSISILYFILFAVSLFLKTGNIFTDALWNTIIIMSFVFYIFGLSFVEHLLKKRIPKSFTRKLILLGISVISVFFVNIPFFALSILGAMDGFINYRQKKPFLS